MVTKTKLIKTIVTLFFIIITALILSLTFSFTNVFALQGADFAIYAGSGTWEPSKTAFKNFLEWKGLTWEEVNKNNINKKQLIGKYRGLFIPGGWAGNYNRDIKSSGDQHIRDFINQGGAYIGMSAGAFYACDITIWEGDVLNYPSNIFDGDCIGPIEEIAPWPEYTMTTMTINQAHEANVYEPNQRSVLYFGEPYFIAHPGQEMQILASWIVPSNPALDNTPGIISFNYGQGRVVLVGPHPEIEENDTRDGTNFADELSDGPDGSDWPFLWTAVDWILKDPISQPPETQPKQCNDGIDNDLDNLTDFPNDPGCTDINDKDETDPTGPVELFSDGFESGTLNNWTTYGSGRRWISSTDQSFEGSWAARAKRTGAGKDSFMEASFDLTGYNSAVFEYNRKLVGLDTADDFEVSYLSNGSWTSVEHLGSNRENNANFLFKSFSIPNTTSKIRFKCECGAVSEKCYVDNVKILAE